MSGLSDKVNVKNGADFSFVCSKIPFAISCLSDMASHGNNLIDLDLVNKMRIPLTNIKVTRMIVCGQSVRSVGFINQTVQCVRRGKVTGTIHLQARVIRDLYSMFDVDCIASSSTYSRLMGKKPPDPLDNPEDDDDELEDHGNLGDEEEVPTTNKEPDEEVKDKEVTNHVRTNDSIDENWYGGGDLNKIIEKDMKYLFAKKSPWSQVCSYPDDDTTGAVNMANSNHTAKTTTTKKTKPVPKAKKDDEGGHCNLCYVSDQPPEVFLSHHTLALECPSMTEQERRQVYGSLGDRRRKGHRS